MKILLRTISWIELLYTFPILIILVSYQILDAVFAMRRHYKKNGVDGDIMQLLERTKSRIISYKNKRFFNIFISTPFWICIYQIFIK
jgi:hypothetical protein